MGGLFMMQIRTTYVMRKEVLTLLDDAQTKTKRKREELIARCLRKMLRDYKKYLRNNQQIEYQKRFEKETKIPIVKQRVKVKFLAREYDYFQDVRKFFSRSISLSIAIAVFNYLSEVVSEYLSDGYDELADNYPYLCYAFIEKCIENITTFRIWWGIPPNLETLLSE
ncbi:MAG: hypothetical protein N2316_13150 [Spirochaetes bacterium]|nr:hypothetical protein [Spirochaetota bacterium]